LVDVVVVNVVVTMVSRGNATRRSVRVFHTRKEPSLRLHNNEEARDHEWDRAADSLDLPTIDSVTVTNLGVKLRSDVRT
jgi:hypothetical protein